MRDKPPRNADDLKFVVDHLQPGNDRFHLLIRERIGLDVPTCQDCIDRFFHFVQDFVIALLTTGNRALFV